MTTATLTKPRELAAPFTREMRDAIRGDRKTQTRRVMKVQPIFGVSGLGQTLWYPFGRGEGLTTEEMKNDEYTLAFSRYQKGDRLYIPEPTKVIRMREGKEALVKWLDDNESAWVSITPQDIDRLQSRKDWSAPCNARFMLKSFARTWLKVVDVWVERLQDISEEDAIAEGIAETWDKQFPYMVRFNYGMNAFNHNDSSSAPSQPTAVDSFRHLWDSINTSRGYFWNSNPWLWVIEFKKVQP